jgi:hypothetical protein
MNRFMIFVLMLLLMPLNALAYPGKSIVTVTGRVCIGAGRVTRSVVNYAFTGPVTVNRGGSSSASLRIFYHVKGGTQSANEGGVIQPSDNEFLFVPEFDRSVMLVQLRSASGWTDSWERPRMTFFENVGVSGKKFRPDIQWNSEVLTVIVTYCDAQGVPDGAAQTYQYTINKTACP